MAPATRGLKVGMAGPAAHRNSPMDVDLAACISGDKHAWDAFVDRCSGLIVAAVQRTLRGNPGTSARHDIDDTVQEVFVRLVKNDYRLLRSYDLERASLSTWLTLVARSVAIDHLRKRRVEAVPLESREVAAASPATTDHSIPLHCLSARQRLVLRMLFDEEMSVAQAARIIGVNEQTVRSTKHKALSRLRDHLTPDRTP